MSLDTTTEISNNMDLSNSNTTTAETTSVTTTGEVPFTAIPATIQPTIAPIPVTAPVAEPAITPTPEATAIDADKLDLSAIPARIRDIATLRGLGYTFREIAEPLDITPQAVSLMLTRHRRCLKSLKDSIELFQLSARAVNSLGRFGVNTREEARQKNVLELLQNQRNCGRKTLDEIERWIQEPSHN